jgi:transcription elongation factor Elf1
MKKQFTCYKCGKVNEYETNSANIPLIESVHDRPNIQIIRCSFCDAENRVSD